MAGVYFAPEAHAAYAALGFDASPAAQDGVARPDLKAYFARSRRVRGSGGGKVFAAAVGCFNPRLWCRLSRPGGGSPAGRPSWRLGSGPRRATAMLQRVLGDQPEGLDRVTERRASHRDLQTEDRPDLAQTHPRHQPPAEPVAQRISLKNVNIESAAARRVYPTLCATAAASCGWVMMK